MNIHLEQIKKLLQDAALSEGERQSLLKAIADADKQWAITDFKLDRTEKVKKTTAILLEETIEELEQKRKAVEAQNKELEIESSLERVRTVAMGMTKREDMLDICRIICEQLQLQKVANIRNVQTAILDEERKIYLNYEYYAKHDKTFVTEVTYTNHPVQVAFARQMLQGKGSFFSTNLQGKSLEEFVRHQQKGPEFVDPLLTESATLSWYWYSLGPIALGLSTYQPLHDPELELFKRFRNVFDLSYRRYLDIEKAEAQSRESEIELALERVRARTMAMQRSDELADASLLLDSQVRSLGIHTRGCAFNIYGDNESTEWFSSEMGTMPTYKTPRENIFLDYYEAGLRGDTICIRNFDEAACKAHYNYLMTLPVMGEALKKIKESGGSFPARQTDHAIYFKYGYLLFITLEPVPEAHEIFKRFAKVFEQTYTRFLDLQKAEAQARESQIELSLERVRAKTMAMHNSNDVGETAAVMVDELKKLGIATIRCGIGIMHEPGDMEVWTISTDENHKTNIVIGWLNMHIHPLLHGAFESWRKKNESYSYELKDEDLISYYTAINNFPGYPIRYDMKALPNHIHHNEFYFPEGILFAFALEQLIAEQRMIFKRFAAVFGQTYRRYLDLKRAEAQTKEAQIEAAMEKIRSRSLAMHQSGELIDVIAIMFEKLRELKVLLGTVGIWLFDKQTMHSTFWVGNEHQHPAMVNLPYDQELMREDTNYRDSWQAWLSGENYTNKKYTTEQKNRYFRYVFANNDLQTIPAAVREFILQAKQHAATIMVEKNSCLFADSWDEQLYDEDSLNVLKRAAKVFEQAYVRFLDLQKAEAQTREAQIEAALERVRSRTLAMQKSEELAETAAVLFQQLILLGIEPNRLYLAILTDEDGASEFWITEEDGTKLSTAFSANLKDNACFLKMYEGWKQQKKSLVIDLAGEELENYFTHLSSLGVLFKRGLVQKRRVQDIAYFSQGFIGIASPSDQPAATIQLLERFAAVFNLTFTRFNDLQAAEAHATQAELDLVAIKEAKQKAEEALAELKITQKQLIQAEKMASLGELTAGIAHEIQNPLNFVNNFSEVSQELLGEMKEALDKGETAEAEGIANDVIQNLDKINYHGKRADGIVKGMLQHSRASSGQKEPTDINVLCDEYLRLAYHGLRAKDKSFNATVDTDFDASIGKINIIPQDIGRVVMNLLTNAFYAVAEKSRLTANSQQPTARYQPTVTISTKKNGDMVNIKVSDNGNGIPQNIIDKIFQPFFTTKPTGQGTGLGLSLSYDIVKTHGGELKVETREGEGSAFIILFPVV